MAGAPPSKGTDAPPSAPPILNEVLAAASVQAASLAVLNAVQHLQRTSVLVETATAVGLVRALTPGAKAEEGWAEALEISRRSMDEALETYRQAMNAAIELGRTIAPGSARDPGK
jgi:hypothetical protein